jgi:hypothetical protein
MSGQTIHSGPIGVEVAYRYERLLAEAEGRRLRALLAPPARRDHRTGFRRAAVAMAAATGLLIVSGAWASLLGAPSSSVAAPAPAAAPATEMSVPAGGGRAGGAVAQ